MGLMDEVLAMAGSSGAQQAQHTTALSAIMTYINSPQVGGIAGLQQHVSAGWTRPHRQFLDQFRPEPAHFRQTSSRMSFTAARCKQAAQQAGMDPSQLTTHDEQPSAASGRQAHAQRPSSRRQRPPANAERASAAGQSA